MMALAVAIGAGAARRLTPDLALVTGQATIAMILGHLRLSLD